MFFTATLASSAWAVFACKNPNFCFNAKQASQAISMSALIFDLIVTMLLYNLPRPSECEVKKRFYAWIALIQVCIGIIIMASSIMSLVWEHQLRRSTSYGVAYTANKPVKFYSLKARKPYLGTPVATAVLGLFAAGNYLIDSIYLLSQTSPRKSNYGKIKHDTAKGATEMISLNESVDVERQ
ncbi:hypothetical protein GJ496_004616 [Pomphorhynchus laevis]|nr:hypothetical protein GJ496_004616 [Pomphorhynchus laevis]